MFVYDLGIKSHFVQFSLCKASKSNKMLYLLYYSEAFFVPIKPNVLNSILEQLSIKKLFYLY